MVGLHPAAAGPPHDRRARLVAVLLLVALAAPRRAVRAGDYHEGSTLNCSECHVMHRPGGGPSAAARRPGRGPAGGREVPLAGLERPAGLLRDDIDELCLSCHDNSSQATDVLGANRGRSPGAVRQAGFLSWLGVEGRAAAGHTLGALETAPGSSPPWRAELENGPGRGLSCTNCHLHHGDPSARPYRNLRADAGNNARGEGLVTYNHERPGSNDLSRDVFVRRMRDYDESAVDFNEPRSMDSAMGRFCAGCHDVFHGGPNASTIAARGPGGDEVLFVRHPTAGVNVGAMGGRRSSAAHLASHRNRLKVMSEVGVWSPPGGDVTPTCISCHKAHGNANPFGLIYRSGTGAPTENGDTNGDSLRHLCGQCHVQGLPDAAP